MDAWTDGAGDRSPVAVEPPGGCGAWSSPWVARATLGFVALGVLVRVVRYLLNYPLWCDESMFAANLLDRGFAGMLRPLDYRQVAPVLFRLIELAAVRAFGFSEWSLRLFPFACGLASVPLFWQVSRRVLRGVPLLLAVGIFAASGWPLKYVAEVKPYASDLLAALGLLALAVEWWRRPGRVGWLWGLAAAGPVAVALSFPAVFVAGGVGLGLLPTAWRSGRRGAWAAYAAFGLGVVATFLPLLVFYRTAPQDHDYFHRNWAPAFPPGGGVVPLASWFVSINTGFLFAYPEGGARGLSALTTLSFAAGAAVLWRRGRRGVVGLCLAPFGLALAAAALHRYPYGMSARTSQYLAPAICLLAGLGAAALLARLPRAGARRRAPGVLAALLAALALGRMGYDVAHPYKYPTDERARAFARWFWTEKARDGELVCVKTDLNTVFEPGFWGRNQTDAYLCYQRIYSPRHRRGEPPRFDAVSPARPLRCVIYNQWPQNTPAFRRWMADMLTRYELRSFERYPITAVEKKKGPTWDSLYVIYEFVPRPGAGPGPVAAAAAGWPRAEGRGVAGAESATPAARRVGQGPR